jgi:hypothetical protein
MLPPPGRYRYELRRASAAVWVEEASFDRHAITVVQRAIEGQTVRQVTAALDDEGRISRISLHYASHLFKRDANYRADNESFRGSVSTVAGRNEIVIKQGRFGEVEVAGLTVFRMLILAHVRDRGLSRWTGRVAVIDPNSLAAASLKQTCRVGRTANRWIYEARMGDAEEIELDEAGRVIMCRNQDGTGSRLVEFEPADGLAGC